MKNKMKLAGLLGVLLLAAAGSAKANETIIDLTGGPPAMGTANGAVLFAADPRPTGTGFINPFLREQNNGSETGVNTSITPPPYDDKPGPFTRDQLVSDLSVISYNSANYYEFALDANQSGNEPISLITFKIFVTTGAPFTSASDLMNEVNTGTPSFDLNNGTPGSVRVDITSNTGSGSGDMFILVPVGDIGTSGNLYLEAGFGADAAGGGFPSNDGFEEWSAITGNRPVPDGGSTMAMLGAAIVGMGLLRKVTFSKS
ncbi:MAG TPA: hypothetical protein VN873_01605 [Candidatus Angelobacter sp.]|nr:hypothetical protein [Candidatus Angelobacter sp.]